MKRRILAVVMSLSMILSVTGTDVYATEGDTSSGNLIVYEAEDEAASEELSEELIIEDDYEELNSNEDNSEALDVSEDENTAIKDTVIEKDNDGVVSANETDSTKENDAIEEIDEELLSASSVDGYTFVESADCGDMTRFLLYKSTGSDVVDYMVIELQPYAYGEHTVMWDFDYYGSGAICHNSEKIGYTKCSNTIKKIKIESGVTRIGNNAFTEFTNLERVEIASSVKSIGSSAFSGCSNLTSVELADGLETIDGSAFSDCKSLSSIDIPNSVTNIGIYAFLYCTNLKSIYIPESVTNLGKNCIGMTYMSSSYKPVEGFTIYGEPGSVAETYAKNNNINFNYKITYELNGVANNENNPTSYSSRKEVNLLVPSNPGFEGWYLDADFTKPITKITTSMTGDITLYAKGYPACGKNAYYIKNDNTLKIKGTGPMYDYADDNGPFYGSNIKNVIIENGVTSIGQNAFNGVGTSSDPAILLNTSSVLNPTSSSTSWFGGYFEVVESNVIKDSTENGSFKLSSDNVNADNEGNFTGIVEKGARVTITPTAAYGYMVDQVKYNIESNSTTCQGPDSNGCYYFPMPDTDGIVTVSVTFKVETMETPDGYKYKFVDEDDPSKGVAITGYTVKSVGDKVIPGKVTFRGQEYTVTAIGDNAFFMNTTFKSVTIPDSVTSIGNYAFYGHTGLESILIPDNVTIIGKKAFYFCKNLKTAVIGKSVTTIGDEAFTNCTSLSCVVIGESVTTIGNDAFSYVGEDTPANLINKSTKVKSPSSSTEEWYGGKFKPVELNVVKASTTHGSFSLGADNIVTDTGGNLTGIVEKGAKVTITPTPNLGYETNTVSYAVVGSTNITCQGPDSYGNYSFIVPEDEGLITVSVTFKGNRTVTTSDGLKFVSENESTKEIGVDGYEGSAKELTIPDKINFNGQDYSVIKIRYNAFNNCTGLEKVTIPDSVTTIGNYAFYNCTGLQSITLPDSLTTIGDSAFKNCTSLQNITLPDSLTTIVDYAFYNCTGLKNITLPDSLTTIKYCTFYNCTGLQSITIPSSVTTIDDYAFCNCTGLQSITLPDSVTTIVGNPFRYCKNINKIVNNSNMNVYLDQLYVGLSSDDINAAISSWYYYDGYTKKQIEDGIVHGKITAYAEGYVDDVAASVVDASLSIGDKIGVNLYMTLPSAVADRGGSVSINGIKQSIPAPDAKGQYKFTTMKNAKEFDDEIVVEVFDGSDNLVPWTNENTQDGKFSYSVRTYINEAKKSEDANLKALAEALDVYGYCAQDYFGYNAPANTPVVDTSVDLSSYEMTSTGSLPEGLKYVGSSLILESSTTIRHYFRTSGTISDYLVKMNGKELNWTNNSNGNIYYLEITGIKATALVTAPVITITKNDNEETVYTMNYSAMSYCNKAVNSDNDKLKKLAYSLYNYYKASDDYAKSLTNN